VTKRCVALEDCLSTGCSEQDHGGNKVRSGNKGKSVEPSVRRLEWHDVGQGFLWS
jgi:hypothetical protein